MNLLGFLAQIHIMLYNKERYWCMLMIASLTLMKDSERLDLLKEIGGTRVYEERRRESLKIMQDTGKFFQLLSLFLNFCYLCLFSCYRCYYHVFYFETGNKRKQIIQVVQYLDKRLKELDAEKDELRDISNLTSRENPWNMPYITKKLKMLSLSLQRLSILKYFLIYSYLNDFFLPCFVFEFFHDDWIINYIHFGNNLLFLLIRNAWFKINAEILR
ncbi:hypothetical protein MtrunA17_Chr5g0440071 [Medicago truncatula]|uniref:Transmembrane protein n=1 Tax=Medicago truncatula TaxID=3880 RepID=A0A396HVS5_MEDTR|nr:hypothetical protein MtrunA17_Chr5g0440071 [Medicago truncatula]